MFGSSFSKIPAIVTKVDFFPEFDAKEEQLLMLTSKVAELEECANSNAQSVESQVRHEAANFQQQIANLKTKFMQERTGMVTIAVLFCLLLVKKS